MSALDLERIEAQHRQFKSELAKRGAKPVASLLTLSEAAQALSITAPALRELITANVILTVEQRGRTLVPRSEVDQLAAADPPKVWLRRSARESSAALGKLRKPPPGGKALALKVRAAKRGR